MQEVRNFDRFMSILVVFATIGTIIFNSLAAAGYVGGVLPSEISSRYPTVLTPAGYAFSIWSLIYLGISAFSIFQALPSQLERFRGVRTLYIASCVLNCAWIYFWHNNQIAVCFAIILLLLATLISILFRIGCMTVRETWLVQAPLGIYAGWVTVASIANFAIMLAFLEVRMSSTTQNILAVILILCAAIIVVAVRVKLQNFFYPLAVAWGVTAIAVKQSGNTAIVVAAAAAVVVCLVTAGTFVVNLRDSSSE
ncbi:MAG: TspO/MBR family protein [Pyrinomonadaceae bacterium]